MPADYTIKSGDSLPIFTDTLTYVDGTIPPLSSATLAFAMRSLTSLAPVTLTGSATITNPSTGSVQYVPTAADTAVPGNYMASWVVTFPGGEGTMTWPTDGYLWVEVQPSVSVEPRQIVSLEDAKQYMRIDSHDRAEDYQILTVIEGMLPQIEAEVGPIVPTIYDEWYEGGKETITLAHRPSFGYGTSPIMQLIAASEYRGPIEYPLSLIPSPLYGQIYSVMLNPRLGSITRRTAGGAVMPFMPGLEAIHVVYQAGQSTVPANVRQAALEIVRVNYRTTAPAGRGRMTEADSESAQGKMPFTIPGQAWKMLAPTKKAPAIA